MDEIKCLNKWDIQSKHIFDISGICETLYSGECRWGGGEHYVLYEKNMVKCLNSWDPQSKRQYQIDGVYCALNAGNSQGGQAHGICYSIDQQGGKSNCGYAENIMMTLCSDSHGTPHALCYAIEGNIVDRISSKNGKGYCENVSPTLNTQDKHAICYAIQGNVTRGSKQRGEGFYKDVSPTIVAGDRHAVCFQLCGDRDNPSVSVSETAYCIPANPMSDRGQAVCYKK